MIKINKYLLSALVFGCSFCLAACSGVSSPSGTDQSMQTQDTQSESMQTDTQKSAETPQSNFYKYINAKWLSETKIPEGESSVTNFSQLQEKTDADIREMIKKLQEDYENLKEGSSEKKLVDLYNMAADFEYRNRLGIEPIKGYLDEIRGISSMEDFRAVLVKLYSKGVVSSISFLIDKDVKNSAENALYMNKPEIGLSKKNFEGTDDFALKQQEAFKKYLQDIFEWSGNSSEEAKSKAEAVYNLEKQIAESMLPAEEENDQELLYNPKTWDELKDFAPSVPVKEAAQAVQLENVVRVIVSEPKALEKINTLYKEENLEALKAQLEYRLIAFNEKKLSKDLIEIGARLESAATGVYNVPSDEELAFALVSDNLRDLVARIYTENFFMPAAKTDVINMVQEVKETYVERIKNLDWMTEATKQQALKKLDTMDVKIAYPDIWEDYSDVVIMTGENGGNIVNNLESVLHRMQLKDKQKLESKPSRKEWGLPPHTVNAYYNPIGNEIVFTAAILQAPFYDPNASKEENLGGIGAVIGHEISHAFDKNGSQFDENGNLRNWWDAEDLKKFQAKVDQAAAIYSKLEVAPGYYVNGQISTGEIMADLGGMTVAINIAEKNGYDTKKVFESYAKVWRELHTEEFAISNIEDEHPPGIYRVNNIVNQIDRFYEDFNVKEGDAMYVPPSERLHVW